MSSDVYNITLPEYKIRDISLEDTVLVRHYGLDNIPKTYIENAPNFAKTALRLRDLLRNLYPFAELCIRGLSTAEHNRINGTDFCRDQLIHLILQSGHDRHNANIPGDRYDNAENKRIDIFAYDVLPRRDDDDLIYFFQSFYYYGIASAGHPTMIDIITVYDAAKLTRVEHTYAGRTDIKRDGFVFPEGIRKADCIRCVLKIE